MISGEDGRSPQVFVLFSHEVDEEKSHQIFAFCSNARTLDNVVGWATGKSHPDADQVVINFSTPGRLSGPGLVVGAHFLHPC